MGQRYKIVGHRLCPYVQRVVIVMLETGMAYDRIDIDLDVKPDWLADVSPQGKVPVLQAETGDWLFESGAISNYLDSVAGGVLMPSDPVARARHEGWIRHGDALLDSVAGIIYRDRDEAAMQASVAAIVDGLTVMARHFRPDPYFGGASFGLVDAVFATLFRKFAVLDRIPSVTLTEALCVDVRAWWAMVKTRPSVTAAVPETYHAELVRFIAAKDSHAGKLLTTVLP